MGKDNEQREQNQERIKTLVEKKVAKNWKDWKGMPSNKRRCKNKIRIVPQTNEKLPETKISSRNIIQVQLPL